MNAAEFNALYEIGVPVFAYPGFRPEGDAKATRLVTRTRTKAESVGLDREGVIWVEGHGAYIALTHVDVVTETEWARARDADTAKKAPKDDAFFQPGRTYTRMHRGVGIEFRVCSVDTSPDGAQRVARGWRAYDYSTRWEPTDSDDMDGWTEVTEAVTS